LFPEVNTSAD